MQLAHDEIRRYARHLILPEIGHAGQLKLRAASVLCVGAGGLGSPAALYLAAAGIGKLGVVDFDDVDVSNLQRQILHRTEDIGRPKCQSAEETLRSLNPHVRVVPHDTRLTSGNALDILSQYDLVIDGTDNLPARYLTNDACVLLKKPNVYGSIYRFEGQASLFAPHLGAPCYRCLYPDPPPPGSIPSCAEGGVLGVLPGLVGTIQATEALKLILGIGTPLLGRLLLVNALDLRFRELKLRRDPKCAACGEHPTLTRLIDYDQFCGLTPALLTPALHPDEVTVQELKRALDAPQPTVRSLDVREPHELSIASIPGSLHIPLGRLPELLSGLDPSQTYYLFCHAGIRSLRAVQFLKEHGFQHVKSVQGGIDAWSVKIDPSIPRY